MGSKQFLGEFEELVLLAIIRAGENAYGIPIAELIEGATGKRVSTGALYTTLGRLEEKNFISSWIGEATRERGGRAKKYFRVEAAGRDAITSSENGRLQLRVATDGVLA